MIRLEQALARVQADLDALNVRWALVGALAVSAYVEPRTTRDLDVAIAVESQREVDRLVSSLRQRGYDEYQAEPLLLRENDEVVGVRLVVPGEPAAGVVVDLLFAVSGIEREVAASAERLEIVPGLFVPVARSAHLLAMKMVAGRPRDLQDGRLLLQTMSDADRQRARKALDLITERGFHRGKDLRSEFGKLEAET